MRKPSHTSQPSVARFITNGIAQDLPSPSLHLAADLDGSLKVRVDLASPMALTSPSKWTDYLEFLGKPGTEGKGSLLLFTYETQRRVQCLF